MYILFLNPLKRVLGISAYLMFLGMDISMVVIWIAQLAHGNSHTSLSFR